MTLPAAADTVRPQYLPGAPGDTGIGQVRLIPDASWRDGRPGYVSDPAGTGTWWRLDNPCTDRDCIETPQLAVIHFPFSAVATWYLPPDYRPLERDRASAGHDPRFSRRALVQPLPRRAGDAPLYLHLRHDRSLDLPLEIVPAAEYQAGDLRHVRLISAVSGILGFTALLAACFWLLLRERPFLLFAGMIASLFLYQAFYTGAAWNLGWVRIVFSDDYTPIRFLGLTTVALTLAFLRDFMGLSGRRDWIDRTLLAFIAFFTILAVPAAIPRVHLASLWLVVANLLVITAYLLVLGAAVRETRHGRREGMITLVAWTPLVLATLWRAVEWLLALRGTGLGDHLYAAATAIASFTLALGVGNKVLAIRAERDHARLLATRDPLTDMLNRRAVLSRLDEEIARAGEAAADLSVMFIDLDELKALNDSHGHAVGDECLRRTATAARELVGDPGHLGRLGGDEFLAVLPGVDRDEARRRAERLIDLLTAEPVTDDPDGTVCCGVSIGVAGMTPDMTGADDLVAAADEALYRAKQAGRRRVGV